MHPVFMYMDPPSSQTLSHQTEANYYPCPYYPPNWESSVPSQTQTLTQMRGDSFKHNPFAPCYLPAHHINGACCHHSCSPCHYNFRHPFPSSFHPYYYGHYLPHLPNAYPTYVNVPPPHYSSLDQAQYDFDDKTKNHSCGCPNHTCHQRDNNYSPKIEEHLPEKETNSKDSSSLIQLPPDYPYPLIWVPQPSLRNGDNDKVFKPQLGQWNSWIPFDMNNVRRYMQDTEGRNGQGEEKTQLPYSPFPVIWMPGYDKAKDVTEMPTKSVNECPLNVRIVPLKLLENENQEKKQRVPQDEEAKVVVQPEAPIEKQGKSKTKTIPVNQLEQVSEKQIAIPQKPEEKVDQKQSPASEKQKGDSEVKKTFEKKQSSPSKSSKLPPVCLRVDPLPRRKTANGTSRSPSPPGLKRNDEHNEEQNTPKEPRNEIPKKSIPEKDIPIVNSKNNSIIHADKEEEKCEEHVSVAKEATVGSKHEEKKEYEEIKSAEREQDMEVNKGQTITYESEPVDEMKGGRWDLSPSDAAIIIQSAYRGFEVRKWQPLKKLRKITEIRNQLGAIRSKIESENLDAKQRVVIGETIMNLLLQLDTIQGLHPSVKEVRKSAAKELVYLQEKLDSLGSQLIDEHVQVMVEAAVKASDGEDTCVSSANTVPSLMQDSIKQMNDNLDRETMQEAEQLENGLCDRSQTHDVARIGGLPLVSESNSKLKAVKAADETGMEDKSSFENEESNQFSDKEFGIHENLSLGSASEQNTNVVFVTKPASDQIFVQPTKKGSDLENQFLENCDSDWVQGKHEDRIETEWNGLSSSNIEVPAVPVPVPEPELAANDGPHDQEQSTNALVFAEKEKTDLFGGEEMLFEPLKEVNNQEPAAEEEMNNSRASHVAKVNEQLEKPPSEPCEPGSNLDVADFTSDAQESEMEALEQKQEEPYVDEDTSITSPKSEHAVEVDNVEKTMPENLEVPRTENGLCPSENELKIAGEEIEGPVAAINEVVDNPDINQDSEKTAAIQVGNFGKSSSNLNEEEKRLLEENEKLRVTLEKLLSAGKEQLEAISNLNGRVKDLERKLAHKRKVKVRRNKPVNKLTSCEVSC